MLKSKFENILLGNTFLGIEIFSENSSDKINAIIVHKKKDRLTIANDFKFNHVEDIKASNFSDLPVILTIYTDKILIKETELIEKNDTVLVKKNFPNLNIEEFYFDIWRLDGKSIISIARRTYVDEILNLFQEKNKLRIASINIGISNIKHIIDFVSEEDVVLNSKSFNKNNISIELKEQIVSKGYFINGIDISSNHLIAFSGIIDFIGKTKKGSIDLLNSTSKENFFQDVFFKKYLKLFIYVLLIALVINFLFFNYYFNRFNEVSVLGNTEIGNRNKLEDLKKIIIDKENNVNELSQSNARRISSILNDIGQSIPTTILLNELQFQPLLKKGNTEALTEYSEKNIVIAGTSNSNTAFTNWIEKLSTFKGVDQVTIVRYEKENDNTSFKINLLIK